ncbi:hypothetical protein KAI32_02480 [Candidatus Pacearchaeota archaeon]|nr:hypothetical protein [Candidatus Pacearchaeota archaeon]
MRKNAQIHLLIETELFDLLKKESENSSICFSEYCRRKLRENCKLEVVERLLKEALKRNGKE